jgi:hypothetical protein
MPYLRRGEVDVVLGILFADLQHVVVAVHTGHPAPDAMQLHCLEMHHGRRAGDVLDQDFVDPNADLFTRGRPAVDQMRGEDFPRNVIAHGIAPSHRLAPRRRRGAGPLPSSYII